MLLRVLLNLVILLAMTDIFSSTAGAQEQNDQCTICDQGVSIESYNYTMEVHHLDDNTTSDVLMLVYTCSKVEQDAISGSLYNTTCYLSQEATQATVDCICAQLVAPTAPQQQHSSPTAPSTAPPASSTAVGTILGYSIAGVVFMATTASCLA